MMVIEAPKAIPFPQRTEFHSVEWISSVEEQLVKLGRRYRDALAGLSFSRAEVYRNAPPHLKLPNDTAACTIRLRDGQFAIERFFDGSADLRYVGDYHAALPVAQAVGDIARRRALRETQHVYGEDGLKISGEKPVGVLGDILRHVADYMARRTIDNPDLDHRILRQGLTRQVEDVATRGYSVIERAISEAFADELTEACLDVAASHHSGLNKTGRVDVNGLLRYGRVFEEISQVPQMRTLMETSLGSSMILHTVGCSVTRPGPGGINLHTDYPSVPDPYPEFALLGTAVWALEDWTVEAGPTWIIPGSQDRRRAPRASDTTDGGVPILMPKGSVTFFTQGVWHWQGVRTVPTSRVALHNAYSRPFFRQADDFSRLDHILDRNSPILSGLVGADDHFGKTSHTGHDAGRLVHLNGLFARETRRKRARERADTDGIAAE